MPPSLLRPPATERMPPMTTRAAFPPAAPLVPPPVPLVPPPVPLVPPPVPLMGTAHFPDTQRPADPQSASLSHVFPMRLGSPPMISEQLANTRSVAKHSTFMFLMEPSEPAGHGRTDARRPHHRRNGHSLSARRGDEQNQACRSSSRRDGIGDIILMNAPNVPAGPIIGGVGIKYGRVASTL